MNDDDTGSGSVSARTTKLTEASLPSCRSATLRQISVWHCTSTTGGSHAPVTTVGEPALAGVVGPS